MSRLKSCPKYITSLAWLTKGHRITCLLTADRRKDSREWGKEWPQDHGEKQRRGGKWRNGAKRVERKKMTKETQVPGTCSVIRLGKVGKRNLVILGIMTPKGLLL